MNEIPPKEIAIRHSGARTLLGIRRATLFVLALGAVLCPCGCYSTAKLQSGEEVPTRPCLSLGDVMYYNELTLAAQDLDIPVTLAIYNKPMTEFLSFILETTGISSTATREVANTLVTVTSEGESLRSVLRALGQEHGLLYRLESNTQGKVYRIVMRKAAPSAHERGQPPQGGSDSDN